MIVKESILAENYELTKENARLKSENEMLNGKNLSIINKNKDITIKNLTDELTQLKSERKAFRDWVVRETWSCRRYRKMGNKFIQKELVLSEYLTLRDVLKQLRAK